jgi:hypothetical protein
MWLPLPPFLRRDLLTTLKKEVPTAQEIYEMGQTIGVLSKSLISYFILLIAWVYAQEQHISRPVINTGSIFSFTT